MRGSHSNLHFVNLSKPTEGKDEETRKAVRTHVMQQYIQKKRLGEKRRATRKPLFEHAQPGRCDCTITRFIRQAESTRGGGGRGDSAVCLHCQKPYPFVKLPCLDEAGGEGSSGQQAMVPGMPQGNWQVGRLNRRLGAGRVDPFGAYPVETQPYMHELLDHYFVLLGEALVPANVTGQQSPIITKWMRLAVEAPALFYGTLLTSSSHYAVTRDDPRDETITLVNRGRVIRALNDALADPKRAVSDECITGVMNLAGYELFMGNYTVYECHMNGLENLVNMRGGLHRLGLDGLTAVLAQWLDQSGATLTGSKPRFSPARIPTLVPEAESPDVILPRPIPMETLDAAFETICEADEAQNSAEHGRSSRPGDIPEAVEGGPVSKSSAHTSIHHSNPILSTLVAEVASPSSSTKRRPGRNEMTAILEVIRFTRIAYPKRRWSGFVIDTGDNDQPSTSTLS